MKTYELLECAMYWPGEKGNWGSLDEYEIEIHLPDGPELYEDPMAGILTFQAQTMDLVVFKCITVLERLGFRGTLYINDETWRINYARVDFTKSAPSIRPNYRAIARADNQMARGEA